MALQFEVENLESVDESLRGLYSEHEGKYRLAVEGIDPADELKGALQKEREERKRAKEELERIRQAQEAAELERQQQAGEFKSLFEKTRAELEAERKKANEFRATVINKELDNAAMQYAVEHAADAKSAKLLQRFIRDQLEYNDGIVGKGGVSVDDAVKSLIASGEYDALIKGRGSSGGGATGGSRSGATLVMERDKFESLPEHERMKFIKSGGKVQ